MVDGVNQQPGLFQRIGNFFGADDPNAGAPTDPFAGLSRAQRTMLGFAALRDAAASLEGRDTDFFAQSLGGFEQARERERLRAQGEFANRNQALFQLAQLEFLANQPGNEGLRPLIEAQRQILVGQVGSAVPAVSSAAGGAMPSAGVVPSTVAPAQGGNRLPRETVLDQATGQMVPYTGEPEVPQPTTAPAVATTIAPAAVPLSPFDQEISDIDAQIEQRRADLQNALDQLSGAESAAVMGFPIGTGGIAGTVDQIQSDINTLQDRRKTLEQRLYDEQQAATAAAATAASRARPTATAAGIAVREVDDMLTSLGFDPETGEALEGGSRVGGPRARIAAQNPMGQFIGAGSETVDFVNNLQSLMDTIAIQRLLEIKEAGAGLGAIPQSQLEALARALGNLNPSTSDEVLARNLSDIRRLYTGIIENSLADSNDPTFRGLVADIASGGGDAASGAGGSQMPRITNDADYDALPSGAQFIDPDGVLRRKP